MLHQLIGRNRAFLVERPRSDCFTQQTQAPGQALFANFRLHGRPRPSVVATNVKHPHLREGEAFSLAIAEVMGARDMTIC